MHIKTIKKVEGIPAAKVAVASGKTALGAAQVTAFLSAVGGVSDDVVASLRLSAAEARDLAARLIEAATKAEAL